MGIEFSILFLSIPEWVYFKNSCPLCKSRSEARTNIIQGGVSIDGVAEKDFNRILTGEELRKGILLRRGKKNYKKIVLK